MNYIPCSRHKHEQVVHNHWMNCKVLSNNHWSIASPSVCVQLWPGSSVYPVSTLWKACPIPALKVHHWNHSTETHRPHQGRWLDSTSPLGSFLTPAAKVTSRWGNLTGLPELSWLILCFMQSTEWRPGCEPEALSFLSHTFSLSPSLLFFISLLSPQFFNQHPLEDMFPVQKKDRLSPLLRSWLWVTRSAWQNGPQASTPSPQKFGDSLWCTWFADGDVFVPFRVCRSPTHSVCVCPGEQPAPVFHRHPFCLLQLPETSVRDPAAGSEDGPQRPATGSKPDSSSCNLGPSCCFCCGRTVLRLVPAQGRTQQRFQGNLFLGDTGLPQQPTFTPGLPGPLDKPLQGRLGCIHPNFFPLFSRVDSPSHASCLHRVCHRHFPY